MMANISGSTNNDNNLISPTSRPIRTEKAPLIQRKFFRNLRGALGLEAGTSTMSQSQGYVQFEGFQRHGRTLGTFAGVFSPVALSMFSALLFLRVGFIVGNAGILVTLFQFVIAYGILIFTVASVCAVSTNGAVEGGGAYFMISRTLGPEFGGSIGTLFFLANVVSSALYIVGCAEGFVENFGPSGYLAGSIEGGLLPDGRWWRFLYCSVLNLLNLIVCLIGAGMFAKTSVVILAIVCICLFSTFISFLAMGPMQVEIPLGNNLINQTIIHSTGNYTGLSSQTLRNNLWSNYSQDYTSAGDPSVNFAIVFGVLFSGVTGIMAGANMSGELRDPARNIPKGTLSAVGFTFLCYTAVSLLTAATCDRYLLQNNYIFLLPINIWPPFVTIGILTATFSASLSNMIGSSRVLEALAKDNVFGSLLHFVSKGVWKGNPIAAVLFSWLLVQIILFIGSLNTIAQINSVLFLLSYLATNLACLGLELTSAPNFRPSFKYFTWYTALIGLIGTLLMMFVINAIYASSSIVLCLLLVIVLHLFSPSKHADWGSISQALIFHQVRKYLLMLDSRKDHVKFWRPQMLLMVRSPKSVCPLIQFVNDLKKSGLYVLGHVKVGDFHRLKIDPTLDEYPHWLSLIDHLKVKAFVEITVADTVRNGIQHMIRMSGLGAMKPNTIVLGFYDDSEPIDFFHSSSNFQTPQFDGLINADGTPLFNLRSPDEEKLLSSSEYVGIISDILRMKKNVCICRHFQNLDKTVISKSNTYKYIDVWPTNFFQPEEYDLFDTTSLFMLQLACIINMVPSWKHLKLRVFLCENEIPTINTPFKNNEDKMKQLLQQLRISAKIYQISSWPQQYQSLKGYSLFPSTHLEVLSENKARAYLLSINQMIMQNSDQAAASFIYLPSPPNDGTTAVAKQYMGYLTEMTAELPPLILVHGVSAVTSTTL